MERSVPLVTSQSCSKINIKDMGEPLGTVGGGSEKNVGLAVWKITPMV
jgi:hypothetical protein